MRFKTLLRNAQFHGAIRLAEKRCRWWWTPILLLLLGCSLTVVRSTIKRFKDNPTFMVQMETVHTVMPFPSVLVYPEITFRQDKIDQFIGAMKYPPELNESYVRAVITQLAAFYSPDVTYITRDLENLEYLLDYNHLNVVTAGRMLTSSCEETLIRCRWNGKIINCSSLFQMELTGDGYGCVFNGRSLIREIAEYSTPVVKSEIEYYTTLIGPTSGIMLAINQTQKLNNVDLSYKWLALQDTQYFVETTVNGTPLNPGWEHWAQYQRYGFQIADEARSLSTNLRRCRMTDEPLKYFPLYHKSYCLLECEMARILQRCRCVRAVHPKAPGVSHCRARDLFCARHAKGSFTAEDCDCPFACDVDEKYISMSSFRLRSYVHPFDKFYEDLDFSKVTIVRVYLQGRKTKTNARWPYFGPIDLFSQLGGVFNVFFGVSILTILEIIQLICHGLRSIYRKTVVEACQKKRQCKFHTSPKAFGVDPCPGSRRFVEVAYKCRPYEFRSKVGCENDVLHLSCNPHSRVAIYSAQYGRTEYDSIQCPQPRGMKEETCLEPYATETAMRECHGKRRCVLSADSNMFGKPCRSGSRTYLKVVYTCVPRTVLKERYESAPEEDEVAHDVSDLEHDDVDETNDRWWGESAVPPAPAVAAVPPQRPSMTTSLNVTSISRNDPSASPPRHHLAKDDAFDMMYVYIVAGVAGLLLLCIVVGIIRCVTNRNSNEQPKGPDVSATTEIPNGFNDSISEVDNDINITSLSGPVESADSGLKHELQFANVAVSPKINRYVGRPVPNTYPHVSTNMYGQVAEYPIEMPLRTMPHGTLGRGVAVKTLPRVQMHSETDPNNRSLYRYSNAQYYFG